MAMNQKLYRFCLIIRQPKTLTGFGSDPPTDFAVIFREPLTQIMQQQRHVEDVFFFDPSISLAQDRRIVFKLDHIFHRPQRMLIDRVFVILIELK